MPTAVASWAACRAAAAAAPVGTSNRTDPAAAFCASRVSSAATGSVATCPVPDGPGGRPPEPAAANAWNTGVATPWARPVSWRTASTRWLTHGMPSGSAPATPSSRSNARSTDTVV